MTVAVSGSRSLETPGASPSPAGARGACRATQGRSPARTRRGLGSNSRRLGGLEGLKGHQKGTTHQLSHFWGSEQKRTQHKPGPLFLMADVNGNQGSTRSKHKSRESHGPRWTQRGLRRQQGVLAATLESNNRIELHIFLGVDSLSILFNHRSFQKQDPFFCWVSGGGLERFGCLGSE